MVAIFVTVVEVKAFVVGIEKSEAGYLEIVTITSKARIVHSIFDENVLS